MKTLVDLNSSVPFNFQFSEPQEITRAVSVSASSLCRARARVCARVRVTYEKNVLETLDHLDVVRDGPFKANDGPRRNLAP